MSEMKTMTVNGKKYDGFVDPIARAQATAFAVINSASGENIAISDSGDSNLHGLCIYGKTIQDGVPTPDAPVELVSVGDSGSITVSVTGKNREHNMAIATPNGLPGIPVTSCGNYTDANGQQWISDEIDLARGVFVKRVGGVVLDGSEAWYYQETSQYFYTHIFDRKPATNLLCNRLEHAPLNTAKVPGWWADNAENQLFTAVGFGKAGIATTIEAFKAYLVEHPLVLVYVLATPIETPLSEEELAAYADLYTYRDHTTVTNDAGAYMELEYVMDAKKYIDSLVASSTIHQATVE